MSDLPARSRLYNDDLRDYGPEEAPLCATCGEDETACPSGDFDDLPGEWEE